MWNNSVKLFKFGPAVQEQKWPPKKAKNRKVTILSKFETSDREINIEH